MKLTIRESREPTFILFYYRYDTEQPVNFERLYTSTKEGALIAAADKRFYTLEGIAGARVRKYYELGVEYVLLTDAKNGRILYKKPIEEYLKQYAPYPVYRAWVNGFEDVNQ